MRQNTLEVCLPSVLGSIRRSGLPQFILYQSFLKLMPVLLLFLLGKLTILFPSRVGGASFVFPRYPRSFGHRKRFVSRTRCLSRLHVMCVLAFLPSILFRAFFFFSSFSLIIIHPKLAISKNARTPQRRPNLFPKSLPYYLAPDTTPL